jgi:hypothetical protein
MPYESIKDFKKFIEKLKRCCTAISKFNLNSPCLLQFIRINGEYEIIISHDPTNGDRYDFYKIFSTVTKDNFKIYPEDVDCFKCGDDRVSVPVIVSSFDFINHDLSDYRKNIKYYANLKYDFAVDSYYIFPKMVLKAIKDGKITDIRVQQKSYVGPIYMFYLDIVFDTNDPRYRNTLFIHNSDKLNYLYNLYILPFGSRNNKVANLFMEHNKECSSYLVLDPKEWEETYERNRCYNAVTLKGANNDTMVVYHNDFMQKKIVSGTITKTYESDQGNIATLYFDIELNNKIYEYFKYRYYDLGGY